jgi:phage terminase small subunit
LKETSPIEQKEEYDGSTPLKSMLQEQFISNLFAGMNQRIAYREAGYKCADKSLDSKASQLVSNSKVKARIEYKRAKREAESEDKVKKWERSLENIMYFDPKRDKGDKPTLRDRLKAGELLGKRYGIFAEKRILEHSHRQSELEQQEKIEAARLASALLTKPKTIAIPSKISDIRSDTPQGSVVGAGQVGGVSRPETGQGPQGGSQDHMGGGSEVHCPPSGGAECTNYPTQTPSPNHYLDNKQE